MDVEYTEISTKSFYGSKLFNTLPEALDALNDNQVEEDIVLLPPEVNDLTDEEEYDDNDMESVVIPNDVPGQVLVNMSSLEADDDFSTSDDEPLSALAAKKKKKCEMYSWKKCDPVYSTFQVPIDSLYNARADQLITDLKNLTPTDIFEKFVDDSVIQLIVDQTNLYAQQKNNHNFSITPREAKTFIAILLLTGYHQLPQERMYWSLSDDVRVNLVAKSMSRNRFLEIKRYLHLADNNQLDKDDKMFKLRPLMKILNKKFMQWGIIHTELSIDEAMIKYFGHHPAKQFIRGKPVRFGYKDWMLCSSTGYCYAFDTYCGKNNNQYSTTETLGAKVVLSLLENVEFPEQHVVYFDNYFTTLELMKLLKVKKIRATGTIRENRIKKCPVEDNKSMKKAKRGYFDHRFDKNNQILIVKWVDNSICTMASNFDSIEPLSKVRRWSKDQKAVVDVPQPLLYKNYNRGMGGVDLNDQSVNTYRIGIRGKKWWWVLFTHMINLGLTNGWKLSQIASEIKMTQLEFTRYVARSYLLSGRNTASRKPSVPLSVICDSSGHYPKKLEKQLRCAICHSRIRWCCKKCNTTLCIERECFEVYHTNTSYLPNVLV